MIDKIKIYEIANNIAREFNPQKIFLFGSYASDNPTKDSDLDLLVIKESVEPRHRRANAIKKSLIGSMFPIDIVVYTPDEFENEKNIRFSFINDAIKNSRLLYERT